MSDGELYELAAEPGNLTETAQQVLRDEMKIRGLDDPRKAAARDAEFAGVQGESGLEGELAPEFTWKTELCQCGSREEAWQVNEALRQAGIESWIERGSPQVMVAADQLAQAREVVARPIPPEIVEMSKMTLPEYEAPVCPGCGAAEPLLEGVDPFNLWLCEACGTEWSETADNPEE